MIEGTTLRCGRHAKQVVAVCFRKQSHVLFNGTSANVDETHCRWPTRAETALASWDALDRELPMTSRQMRCREKSVITVEKSGASSIVDASRRASSRIDVGLLPHLAPGPDAEVTTSFRQWNIVSRRGKISTKRRSSRMQAIDMRLMTRTSSTFPRHDLWPLQKARTQPSYMR
ncbi:BZ3500_MvSof-1268-A1-R1_Chr1-3g02153 [Microbotryum saponariae]|uniref:BZ3500_MvSof-1268-A1-R1_Chr1-3g02153 protein n=1 Tax=Microbotryum saponariae TaxID=289078 RepID=A0A2X0M9E4_9BASI|nr:BZ3500_MvSof-1268-A1-R1_Chr1-3g02153 [Microbotryum saponariae]SCZ95520.1 BZ3501_MvSof-1269-A2-R1_Chr1-3g01756 [Microbotryum saponariae]